MRLVVCRLVALMMVTAAAGCGPRLHNWAGALPDGVLAVPYKRATRFSSCLVAATAMAAEYVDQRPFSEPAMRRSLHEAGLSETRPGDVAEWLRGRGLDMIVLAGTLSAEAPLGIEYWLTRRGYPVVCIINRKGGDPQYNHAVVVVGVQRTQGADAIHFLDPASERGLERADAATFEQWWERGQRVMMIVLNPPAGQDATPAPSK